MLTDKFDAALNTFNKAIALSPKNVKCKFYRATMLINLERYQEALEELNELKRMVPTESAVYFHIGKVCILSSYNPKQSHILILFRFTPNLEITTLLL